jgi:hypothetical protein
MAEQEFLTPKLDVNHLTKRQAIRAASSIGKAIFGENRWPEEEVSLEDLQVGMIKIVQLYRRRATRKSRQVY